MCGIAALFGIEATPVGGAIGAMTSVIRHRGPDDEGYALVQADGEIAFRGGPDTPPGCYSEPMPFRPLGLLDAGTNTATIALGHRRLSILDLSPAGHQPMTAEGGRYVIVFNGEVYNFAELRRELSALGSEFVSTCDTEVVLSAFHHWGPGCLDRFNGMFAFVIYDRHRRRMFAARDRFGIKPLYYWFSPDGFLAVASEIKQFTTLPGWQSRMNDQRVYDYLLFSRADHTDETLFRGVHQLRGGHFVDLAVEELHRFGGRLPVESWYEIRRSAKPADFTEAVAEFRRLFSDSVRMRLRADVPVGTGLSGGLDSSAIVAVTTEILREQDPAARTNSFSACSRVARFDERSHVEKVLERTGARAHFVYPDGDRLFEVGQRLVWHHDEPFPSTSVFAEWNVFELVATTEVKVTLDGHGADELLVGYHGFFGPHQAELLRRGQLARFLEEWRGKRRLHGYGAAALSRGVANQLLPEWLRHPARRLLGLDSVGAAWLDTDVLGVMPEDPRPRLGLTRGGVNDTSRAQIRFGSLPLQLHWADRDSMAHSIESRVPFLDHRLVEFVSACPAEYKLADGWTKRILRESMVGVLPEEIRTRVDKMGFVTPEEVWVRRDAPERFLDAFGAAIERAEGLFTPAALVRARRIIGGQEPFSFFVWKVICFGHWLERFAISRRN